MSLVANLIGQRSRNVIGRLICQLVRKYPGTKVTCMKFSYLCIPSFTVVQLCDFEPVTHSDQNIEDNMKIDEGAAKL